MKIRLAIAAGAALMLTAGFAGAQTTGASTTMHTPTATATTHAVPMTTTTTTHATATNASSSSATPDTGAAISCHTHHAAGEACRCLKAPTRAGTAEAGANGGAAICRVPASPA